MQDRYVGDIGDFGKYALLNALSGSDLRLGVVWYLNADAEDNTDGSFTNYSKHRHCDPQLHDTLGSIVASNYRSVAAVEKAGVLPAETSYYPEPLNTSRVPPIDRLRIREEWFQKALAATAMAELVFLDPDNGFAGLSVSKQSASASKYVFLSEVEAFTNRGQSVIAYHHQTRRKGGVNAEIPHWLSELNVFAKSEPFAIRFRKVSARTYFVCPAAVHRELLSHRAAQFTVGLWGATKCFERW